MKKLLLLSLFCLHISLAFGQQKQQLNDKQIKAAIIGFLKWYKKESNDTTASYRLIKGGPPDTLTKEQIDFEGVEQYLKRFKLSGFVSNVYTDNLRQYFLQIDGNMTHMPKTKALLKIDGLDIDLVLQTYEPEAILDNINKIRVQKKYIIYNKALVSLYVSKQVSLLVILTKSENKWIIDYLGHDLTNQQSLFKQ